MKTSAQYRKIRATMMQEGVTLVQIAKQEDVTETYVTYVVTGRRVGRRIRRAIAKACKVAVSYLWPDETDEHDPELPKAA